MVDLLEILFYAMSPFVFGPVFVVGIIVAVLAARHYKKMPSPAESEKAFLSFKKEIRQLEQEGVVKPDVASAIIGKYQNLEGNRQEIQKQKIIYKLAIFGVVLIGLGVISFIASQWGNLPAFVNMAVLIISTSAVYYMGWLFKYQKANHPKIGSALIVLGSILFGASLILTAQLYNIRIEFSNFFLIWGLAIIPVAYFTKSSVLSFLSSVVIFIWGASSITSFMGGDSPISLKYYLCLFLLLGLIAPLAYKLRSLLALSITVVEIVLWLGIIALMSWFTASQNPVFDFSLLFLAIGAVVVFLGIAHSKWPGLRVFRNIYYPIGLLILFSSTFILTFKSVHGVRSFYYSTGSEPSLFMPIFFNLVLFCLICGAIIWGIKKEESAFINLGALFFGLLVFARYFDSGWPLIAKSLIFIIGGVLLVGAGYIIDQFKEGGQVLSIEDNKNQEYDADEL